MGANVYLAMTTTSARRRQEGLNEMNKIVNEKYHELYSHYSSSCSLHHIIHLGLYNDLECNPEAFAGRDQGYFYTSEHHHLLQDYGIIMR